MAIVLVTVTVVVDEKVGSVDDPELAGSRQSPQWQALQTFTPPLPQSCTDSVRHSPSPAQVDHPDQEPLLQLRVAIPHMPQALEDSPMHDVEVELDEHVLHWQRELQTFVPPPAQAADARGTHTPSFAHVDQVDHAPLAHCLVWLPQRPQLCALGPSHTATPPSTDGGGRTQVPPRHVPPLEQVVPLDFAGFEQTPPLHTPATWHSSKAEQTTPTHKSGKTQLPQVHVLEHVWVPLVPQLAVAAGAQTPPPTHCDQSDQLPLPQVRPCVPSPQFPHDWLVVPTHGAGTHVSHVHEFEHV